MRNNSEPEERSPFVAPTLQPEMGMCPGCNGPAEIHEFWSFSPRTPGVKVLKRQIRCASRPKRTKQWGKDASAPYCAIVTEEVRVECSPAPVVESPEIPSTGDRAKPRMRSIRKGSQITLDQVIDFLAQLDSAEAQAVVRLADLTRLYQEIRARVILRTC